jgi:uncharacterized SAM-binding protein YcdF (DUF218 family)
MSRTGDTEPIVVQGRSAASPAVRAGPSGPAARLFVPDRPTVPIGQSGQVPVRRRRSRIRETAKWVAALLVFALLAPPLLAGSLLAAVYWQARTDETRPVEAIVVLGAAQYNGRPSPVLRARLDRVLEVWEDGVAPLVVVTGGRQVGDAFTEAEASRDYLIEHGVPERAILLENEAHDSWESMEGVARLLENRGISTVLLVSDGFHLLRVKLMARELGLTAYATAADESPIDAWSPSEFGYVVREVAGIAVFAWSER